MRAIDWKATQAALHAAGLYAGAIDGAPGPKTYAGALLGAGAPAGGDFATKAGAILATIVPQYQIDLSRDRLAQFLANTSHETTGYTVFAEDLNYSTEARLMKLWPSRFPTRADATPFLRSPSKLAEKVYGGRFGNPIGRAFDFRGGGWIQTTFYANYLAAEQITHLPLTAKPDLLHDPYTSIEPACAFWKGKGCNELADADTTGQKARLKVNGGTIGLAEVQAGVTALLRIVR